MKLVSIGEMTIDYYFDQRLSFVGGISLNFAVHAKRCGAENVALVSCAGSDEAGSRIRRLLTNEGIDVSHVSGRPGKTATCDIIVNNNAERSFPEGGYRPHGLPDFKLTDRALAFIKQHDVVVSMFDQSQPEAFFNQVSTKINFSGLRVVDFGNWNDYREGHDMILACLDKLDIIFVSGNRGTVDFLHTISDEGTGLIVVTLGALGSIAIYQGKLWVQKAMPVARPVDSTGCGDAFQSAFTVAYLRTGNIKKALRQGAKQAALVLQHYGAFSQTGHSNP